MSKNKKGKIALVIGGSDIGKATALEVAPSVKKAKKIVKKIEKEGGKAKFITANLSKPKQVKKLIGKIVDKYDRLDDTCNNELSGETATEELPEKAALVTGDSSSKEL